MQDRHENPEGAGIMVISFILIIIFLFVLVTVSYQIGYKDGKLEKKHKNEVPSLPY